MPNFAGFLWKKPDFGSGKPDTRSRNLFELKHIWAKVSITWKFQPNWSNNTLKTGFFQISGKSGSRIWIFFGLKPSRDQDGANKKKFSQISPAVPEEIEDKHTSKQTNILLLYKRDINYKIIIKHTFYTILIILKEATLKIIWPFNSLVWNVLSLFKSFFFG